MNQTRAKVTPLKNQALTQKERKHLDWLANNGASPEVIILAIMSAGRSRGWAPSSVAQEIAKWYEMRDSSKLELVATVQESSYQEGE